jgi:glycosyltransferase involved in cell wall biosynthesis
MSATKAVRSIASSAQLRFGSAWYDSAPVAIRRESSPTRVLELRSVRGTGGGPEKTILFGAVKAERARFAVTACYIRDLRDSVFEVDKLARKLGVEYVEIHERHSFDLRIWPKLRQVVRDGRFDVVHAHDYKTDLLALLLARAENVLPIATAHGWSGTSLLERAVYYPADRRLLARYPKVNAVSPAIRDALLSAGGRSDRIAVILNGVDPIAFRRDHTERDAARAALGLETRDIAIGAIGRLEPIKRIDLLIDAAARLRSRHPDLRLIIVGDGSLRSALEARAERLAPGACRFLGKRPNVAAVHQALDGFVQPSDSEGTSNALLEAMAMETPIIATNVGGTPALVRDGVDGLLIPAGSVDLLAEAIERTIGDRNETIARTKEARDRVENELSFAVRQRKLEAVYEQLLASRGE